MRSPTTTISPDATWPPRSSRRWRTPSPTCRDRAWNHRELVLYYEFNGLTGAEVRAARAELALHHEFVDRLAACFAGLVTVDDPRPEPPLRQALYAALGTEHLAYALSYNRDNFPDDD